MKWRLPIIAALFVAEIFVGIGTAMLTYSVAVADTFQAWEYAAIQPSKLGTVEAVDASFRAWQTQYAVAHGGCWDACYEQVVTEWLKAHNCATCYIADHQMSSKLKIDAPNYAPSGLVVPPGDPQPWMYAAIEPSGLKTVSNVQASFYGAQVKYALAHGGCWDHDCTEAAATEWLNAHGCSNCYVKDNQLSFAIKIGAQRFAPKPE